MAEYIKTLASVQDLLQDYDHYDCKTIDGDVSLRQFLAGMLSYYPAWIKFLYGIRWGFVRLLGMKQENFATTPQLKPEDIQFEAGADATIFVVDRAVENQFWVASASDKHLTAYIVVATETLSSAKNHFHVATIVRYHNWAGPIYFNVIRPFHHLVVSSMMRAGIQPAD